MFALRFPFKLPPGQEINEPSFTRSVNNLQFILKKQDQYYVLTVEGFESENEAKDHIPQVWAGLMWVLLNKGLAIKAETTPQKIVFANDPKQAAENLENRWKMEIDGEVHGFIDGAFPAAYNSEESFRMVTANSVTIVQGTNAEDVAKHFLEGVGLKNSAFLFRNEKYKTALELYSAFFSESSRNAKFLTLIMVLETLAESDKRPQIVLELLKDFRDQIEELKNQLSPDSEEFISLESLKRELTFRQEDSIRKQIRSLVYDTLLVNGDVDAEETAKLAVKIYDKRSKLVHEGKIPQKDLNRASSNARRIVERILRAKFIHLAKAK